MTKRQFKQILKHFTFQDKNRVLKKIEKLISEGKSNLHLLVDFDRTLTIGKNKDGRDVTSWNILTNLLPPKALAKQQALYKKYRPLEASGKMSSKEAESWARQVLKIFVKCAVDLREIEKDFSVNTSIRNHAKKVFDICNAFEIPVVILSAGIKEVIAVWSKNHQVSPALVLATSLITDSNGKIIGWDKNIIHVANKREQGHKELDEIKRKRPNIILIGDALEDADMAEGNENVLRIRVFNPREDETLSREDFTKKTFGKFDLMIESGTLEPVLKILEMIE
jgi:HAD superfamily hydrolase (TIGR01544 family)